MANPQHEPTMEEILASIRKIISEDAPASTHEARSNGEADVLDLTQEVHEDRPATEASSPAGPDCRVHEASAPVPQGDGLFTDKTRAAVEGAVAGLSSAEEPAAGPRVPAYGESVEETFERAVRDAFQPVAEKWLADNSETMIGHMKPVIRDWLDEHFPAMLESAVKTELARARSRIRR